MLYIEIKNKRCRTLNARNSETTGCNAQVSHNFHSSTVAWIKKYVYFIQKKMREKLCHKSVDIFDLPNNSHKSHILAEMSVLVRLRTFKVKKKALLTFDDCNKVWIFLFTTVAPWYVCWAVSADGARVRVPLRLLPGSGGLLRPYLRIWQSIKP